MHRGARWAATTLAAAALAAGAGTAHACSCAQQTRAELIAQSALAVEAVALETQTKSAPGTGRSTAAKSITTFRVQRTVKGQPAATVLHVQHATDGAACGIRFTTGASYLLTFTDRAAGGRAGALRTNACRVHQLLAETRSADPADIWGSPRRT